MIKQFKKYRWTNTLVTLLLILTVGLVGLTGCNLKEQEENTTTNEPTTQEENTENGSEITITPTPMITEAPDQEELSDNSASEENNPTKEQGTKEEDSQEEVKEDAEPVPAQTAGESSVEPAPAESVEPAGSSASPQEATSSYYGDYKISKVLAYGQSGTYSKEDAEDLIGKEMSFTADSATGFGDQASYLDTVIKKPAYSATDYTSADFIGYYRMSFDLLGLSQDKVTEIAYKDSKGNGGTFLIKDEDTLIVVGGGTYFELARK